VTVGDSAQKGKTGERLHPSAASGEANADTLADHPQSERVRPPEDSGETHGTVTGDTTAEQTMARDTTADIGQVADTSAHQHSDTVAVADPDTTTIQAQVDTTTQHQDTLAQVASDTAAIAVQVDTTTDQPDTEVAAANQADTATVVGDSVQIGKTGERLEPSAADADANADTLAIERERVRPPEDSTETLGNVQPQRAEADVEAGAQVQADADLETVGDANVDAAGAARVETSAGMVTGAAAVSAMTREGQRCIVLDPEHTADVRWDMASSPASLNPCGTGTMTLPRIWMAEKE
jgi:hypothetical protein